MVLENARYIPSYLAKSTKIFLNRTACRPFPKIWLTIELTKYIGHCTEIKKLTFRAIALRQRKRYRAKRQLLYHLMVANLPYQLSWQSNLCLSLPYIRNTTSFSQSASTFEIDCWVVGCQQTFNTQLKKRRRRRKRREQKTRTGKKQ